MVIKLYSVLVRTRQVFAKTVTYSSKLRGKVESNKCYPDGLETDTQYLIGTNCLKIKSTINKEP